MRTPSALPIPKRKYIQKNKNKNTERSRKMNDSVANALSHNLWRLRNQLNNLTVITLDIMEVTDPQVQLSSSCVTYLSQPLFYLCSEIAWLKIERVVELSLSELFFRFLGHMSSVQRQISHKAWRTGVWCLLIFIVYGELIIMVISI